MKLPKKIDLLGLVAILFMGMASSLGKQIGPLEPLLKAGDKFPAILFEGILTAAEQKYLGIAENKTFVLNDIRAEIIIVEFFNKYCPHCRQFAPMLNVKNYLELNGFTVLNFEPISIDDNIIYEAQLKFKNAQRILFIEEIYRNTVSDVCHDTHLWYSFNSNGKLTHFVPISLPKSHNKECDENDVQKFRNRLLVHSVLNSFNFNPDVDAVTSATITSSLIFDTINKTKKLFKKLNELKIIKQ